MASTKTAEVDIVWEHLTVEIGFVETNQGWNNPVFNGSAGTSRKQSWDFINVFIYKSDISFINLINILFIII